MRHRVLIAAQPAAWVVLERMLGEVADLVPAHTRAEAFQVLERDAASIDLIVCTVAFDESQMIDFLETAKRNPAISSIPFLCARVMSGVLSQDLVGRVGAVCRDCGAVDFLDVATLDGDAAQTELQAAVVKFAARRARLGDVRNPRPTRSA